MKKILGKGCQLPIAHPQTLSSPAVPSALDVPPNSNPESAPGKEKIKGQLLTLGYTVYRKMIAVKIVFLKFIAGEQRANLEDNRYSP